MRRCGMTELGIPYATHSGMNAATEARPADKTSTRRVIFACRCGRKAHDYTATRRYMGTDKWGASRWSDARLTRVEGGSTLDISHDAFCSTCKAYRKSTHVKGRLTGHVCDARCVHATGSDCECSCGGKNHGKAWL